MTKWFLPRNPDVLRLLGEQCAVTVSGMEAFAAWSAGDLQQGRAVAHAEHAADDARRRVCAELCVAFSTPIDAEDLYELSERLDAVLNGAKNAVREAEVMNLAPDGALAAMGKDLADGVRHVSGAMALLSADPTGATAEADAAIACERRVEKRYRAAMSALLGVDDLRQLVEWREMYRRYCRIGDALVATAERVWYAVFKEG